MRYFNWRTDTVPGYYNFCFDDKGNYNYYIQEVALCFKNWTEAERKHTFKGAKFVWNCTGSHYNLLKADNIEDAKKEFEEMYGEVLKREIRSLNEAKARAIETEEAFYRYKNKLGEYSEEYENIE